MENVNRIWTGVAKSTSYDYNRYTTPNLVSQFQTGLK